MASTGLKLYYLRTREKKLTQSEVADAIGIRQATLSHIEQGVSQPSAALLIELSRYYDVTPSFLLDPERGVVPRPTERWRVRQALVTVGMWVEAPRESLRETPDGKILCPLLPGESFWDDEAAALRAERDGDEALAEYRRRASARRRRERKLEQELEAELANTRAKRRRS